MARSINSIDELKQYFEKVLVRADHHAQGVNEVALSIMGGIVWKSVSFQVMEVDGDVKNVLWMKTGNGNFYFTYDHSSDEILVKEGNSRGPTLATFTNTSSNRDVKAFFSTL